MVTLHLEHMVHLVACHQIHRLEGLMVLQGKFPVVNLSNLQHTTLLNRVPLDPEDINLLPPWVQAHLMQEEQTLRTHYHLHQVQIRPLTLL